MSTGGRVEYCSPQNISAASQENSVAAFSGNCFKDVKKKHSTQLALCVPSLRRLRDPDIIYWLTAGSSSC